MEEARRHDPRWQWWSRDFISNVKLLAYLCEADYVREWGTRWSPAASGVHILFPGRYEEDRREFAYQFHAPPQDQAELKLLARYREQALAVPIEAWLPPAPCLPSTNPL